MSDLIKRAEERVMDEPTRTELVTEFVIFVVVIAFLAFTAWTITTAKNDYDKDQEPRTCITPSMQEVECP